jgi:hypothetical protein
MMGTVDLQRVNGHSRADTNSITLSSGITVKLNRQPADVMAKAQAAAQRALADSKPEVPTQSMETEPGVFRDIPNEHDPAYQLALAAWHSDVNALTSQKLLTIIERIGVVFEVDHARLSALRETYAALDIELPENDRTAYLSYVVAPTHEDQARLFEELFGRGLPQEAQVALHRRMFPGDMARDSA